MLFCQKVHWFVWTVKLYLHYWQNDWSCRNLGPQKTTKNGLQQFAWGGQEFGSTPNSPENHSNPQVNFFKNPFVPYGGIIIVLLPLSSQSLTVSQTVSLWESMRVPESLETSALKSCVVWPFLREDKQASNLCVLIQYGLDFSKDLAILPRLFLDPSCKCLV